MPDWRGEVCAIVASGSSVNRQDVERLRGRCRVIVINNGHQLAPWADLLYAADGKWWKHYPAALEFAGLKVTADREVARQHGLKLVTVEGSSSAGRILMDRPGVLGHGGNGSFQAVNLAVQAGVRRELWLGFDFKGGHWHPPHGGTLRNSPQASLARWAGILDGVAGELSALGMEIVNCSMASRLQAYPKMPLPEAMARWGL